MHRLALDPVVETVEPGRERRAVEELPAGLVHVREAGTGDARCHPQPLWSGGGPQDGANTGQAQEPVRHGDPHQVLLVHPEVRDGVEQEVGGEPTDRRRRRTRRGQPHQGAGEDVVGDEHPASLPDDLVW